jgi:transcriptional regulator with XRE-family HTH domain
MKAAPLPFDPVRSFLGADLRTLRVAAGLTQHELAAQLGVRPERVSVWENHHRHPSAAMLVRIVRAFQTRGAA